MQVKSVLGMLMREASGNMFVWLVNIKDFFWTLFVLLLFPVCVIYNLYIVCCTRSLLADIVKIKMEHYEMSKVRSQSAEEYLKAFFDAELKPIWPQGWIQTRFDTHAYCHEKMYCKLSKFV